MSIPDFAAEWIALTIRDDGQQQQQQQHRDMNALVLSLKSLRGLNSLLGKFQKCCFWTDEPSGNWEWLQIALLSFFPVRLSYIF